MVIVSITKFEIASPSPASALVVAHLGRRDYHQFLVQYNWSHVDSKIAQFVLARHLLLSCRLPFASFDSLN